MREEGRLTNRQKLFIDSYLVTMNATNAAIEAKYSKKTARQLGSQLLANINIRAEIEKRLTEIHEGQRRALIQMSGAAITALQDIAINGKGLAKVSAANSILDRAGHKPTDHLKADLEVGGKDGRAIEIDVVELRSRLTEKFNRLAFNRPNPETNSGTVTG